MQDGIQCEYGRIAVVTTDTCDVSGAFREGLGLRFRFSQIRTGRLPQRLS